MPSFGEPLLRAIEDYRELDRLDPDAVVGEVWSTEDFPGPRHRKIERRGLCRLPLFGEALFALELLFRAGRRRALLLNQVEGCAIIACILNHLLPFGKRRIVLYDVFIDTPSAWKRRLVRWMVRGATINVVFSRPQVAGYARLFDLPQHRIVYVPYQSSHSKRPPLDEAPGDYVWSGGNSARDYATLLEAIRGTGIPLWLTSTRPELRSGDLPDEVELHPAQEPEFTNLMARSRFVVLPLTAGRVRGYGEQSILNSMWHGRAVISCDDVSAADYIAEGTGFVLPPGDAEALRSALQRLWSDPEACGNMGSVARDHVRQHFTHDHFVRRMRNIALLLSADASADPK